MSVPIWYRVYLQILLESILALNNYKTFPLMQVLSETMSELIWYRLSAFSSSKRNIYESNHGKPFNLHISNRSLFGLKNSKLMKALSEDMIELIWY